MASYKFWSTQPVPKFSDEKPAMIEEGPIKIQEIKDMPQDPPALLDGFRWVQVDLTNENEMQEVYKLLNGHYVEDNESYVQVQLLSLAPQMVSQRRHPSAHHAACALLT